jgi:hypothetical protein
METQKEGFLKCYGPDLIKLALCPNSLGMQSEHWFGAQTALTLKSFAIISKFRTLLFFGGGVCPGGFELRDLNFLSADTLPHEP